MNTKAVEKIDVPGYQGRAIEVRKGDLVRVIDVEGCQIGDLFLIARDDPMEIFSPALTRLVNFTPFPRIGESFISSRRRPMVTLIADKSPGRHDMTFAPCDPELYRTLNAGDNHPSCRNNFERAMQAMVARILVDAVRSLDLSWPEVSDEDRAKHAEARRQLAAE